MSASQKKLLEAREIMYGASQALWTIAAVLKDREMQHTASSASDLAEMLGSFSSEIPLDGESA